MNQRPPISTAALKDILARRKDDPEVLALLWEIWRYRRIAIKAYNLAVGVQEFDETRKLMKDGLLNALKDDPALISHEEWKSEMLAPYQDEKKQK